jgi:HEPN domain-containing protein
MSGADRSEAARWLTFAEDDLGAAQILRREATSARHVCFLAQQAAEKALKAILVSVALRRLLPGEVEGMPTDAELAELTQWASQARYPGDFPEPTAEDADGALRAAEQLFDAAAGAAGP